MSEWMKERMNIIINNARLNHGLGLGDYNSPSVYSSCLYILVLRVMVSHVVDCFGLMDAIHFGR